MRSFVDSNVLVYTDDPGAPRKRRRALSLVRDLVESGDGAASTQVLQEYYVAATRKLGVQATVARRKIELFARLDIVRLDVADILAAIDLQRLHQLSFWDALIVRAARGASCRVLYTEDRQPRPEIEGLRIVDPFAA